MFSGKKSEGRPKRDRTDRNLAQYGLFDMSANFNPDGTMGSLDDNGDDDLEAELAALAGGGSGKKPRRPARPTAPVADLDSMVAASMKDIPSDAELSGDDDDPELLNELGALAGEEHEEPEPQESPSKPSSGGASDVTQLLSERLKMYEQAEQIAKSAGETGRARRFGRGLKTIKDLLKQAKSGAAINDEDIPPEVSTGPRTKPAEPSPSESPSSEPAQISRPAPPIPSPQPVSEPDVATPSPEKPEVDETLLKTLTDRQKQYKLAALAAKKSGDSATAISYIKVAKQFEAVIAAVQTGQPVDLSKMPGPPLDPTPKLEESQVQKDSVKDTPMPEGEAPEENLIMAGSVLEALEQRFEVYKKQEESAKEQGNSGKSRRMGRIVKQFEQAIKAHQAGKPIAVDELPTPPGYGPIPVKGAEGPKTTADPPTAGKSPEAPKVPPRTAPVRTNTTRITGNQMPNSRADKQLALLLAKQKQFKEAALNAKRKGEIDQAKEFLRTAKGFEPLIEAASCGMPVDLATLPLSPEAKSQLDNEYDLVMTEECTEENNTDKDVLTRLENQLTKQLKLCLSTRDHFKAMGDVAGTNRFERLALTVTKDLDVVRLAHRTPGAGIPKFHYESKDFSIVKSFTELDDNVIELTILRGISYTCANPKEVDTYVKFEFPYPQEQAYSDRTATVKDTNNPEYNATYTIPIQRTARACQRVFKRHSLKLEVYSKGGWFKGDSLLGTATVKLQPLETQCELHDSYELLEGRKKVGGKLEVRLRLRHPIVSQEVEQMHEKWLVVDS